MSAPSEKPQQIGFLDIIGDVSPAVGNAMAAHMLGYMDDEIPADLKDRAARSARASFGLPPVTS